MKILHILDHSLPVHSGYTFRSHEIFRVQSKRGWDPIVLTSPKQTVNPGETWRPKEVIEGIVYYRTKPVYQVTDSIRSVIGSMNVMAKRIREIVSDEKPDIIHCHSPVLNAIPALWVGRRLNVPVIYEIRAFWEDAAVDHGSYGGQSWKYRAVRFLETRICRMADQVLVICQGLRGDLINRGISSEKVSVVGNGVNPDDFAAVRPDSEYATNWGLDGRTVIGFVGSFYRYEGLDLLIDAFARLATKRPDVVLLLVGGGAMEDRLRAQIARLNLEKRVLLPGRIPHERIPGVYALIDILVYPRYSTRLTELVTPLKPLEAMAMGKAVVASDVGGHKELIHDGYTGLLFPAGNLAALAETLDRLISDQKLRESLERQELGWVHRERSWEKTTAVHSNIYSAAVEDMSGPISVGRQRAG